MKIAYAEYKFKMIDDVYSNGISLREAYLKMDIMLKKQLLGNTTYVIMFSLEWEVASLRYFIKCIQKKDRKTQSLRLI